MVRPAALATLLAAGCLFALGVPRPAAALATTPHCQAPSLHLEFVRENAAASHRFWDLALRNVGSMTCHLRGYPGAALLDRGAKRIHVTVDRTVGFPIHNVVLRPWHRAFFTFTFVASGPCVPNFFLAYGVQIIPPGGTQATALYRGRFDVCSPSVGGNPQVSAVRSRSTGP